MRRVPFVALNAGGAVAFIAPFILSFKPVTNPSEARASDAPWLMALLVPLLIGLAISELSKGRLDSKAIALLGVLSGCAALLRLPLSFAGANLFFFLPIVGGFVFGSTFGFLLGSLGMGASALITGGIGPWLPFQMWAAGWVGAGAGSLRYIGEKMRPRIAVISLSVYAYLAAFFFGAAMDLYFWPVIASGDGAVAWKPGSGLSQAIAHFKAFYVLTSLAWDSVGAVANVVMVLSLGGPVIVLFRRYRKRFSFEAPDASVTPTVTDASGATATAIATT
ncbi:MAG: ECF transporter S component [Actinomycetota bacterium]